MNIDGCKRRDRRKKRLMDCMKDDVANKEANEVTTSYKYEWKKTCVRTPSKLGSEQKNYDMFGNV
jgi:hypothetical protein